MQCKIYKDICCLNEAVEEVNEEEFNNCMCHECLIHSVIEHDKLVDEGKLKY